MVEELSDHERDDLRQLGEVSPPPGLENRVVEALRSDGQLTQPGTPSGTWMRWVAAALVVFLAGVATQRWVFDRPTATVRAESDRYLLLLLEAADSAIPADEEARRVDEYRNWAQGLAGRGLLEGGEKLADARAVVPGPDASSPDERVTGFFIVRVDSAEAATAIAEASPHVRYGGRVEVRRIEPT